MPTYGKDKQRTMVRSVLPSTRRKGARHDKRHTNQKHRSAVRQALHEGRDAFMEEANDWWGISADSDYDFLRDGTLDRSYAKVVKADRTYDRDIKEIMWDRRNGDKLSAFMAWAPHQVEGVRRLDRLSKIKAKLPDNLPGRHAVSHLQYEEDFYVEHEYRLRYFPVTEEGRERREREFEERDFLAACRYAAIEKCLAVLWEDGNICFLNNVMGKDFSAYVRMNRPGTSRGMTKLMIHEGATYEGPWRSQHFLERVCRFPELQKRLVSYLTEVGFTLPC